MNTWPHPRQRAPFGVPLLVLAALLAGWLTACGSASDGPDKQAGSAGAASGGEGSSASTSLSELAQAAAEDITALKACETVKDVENLEDVLGGSPTDYQDIPDQMQEYADCNVTIDVDDPDTGEPLKVLFRVVPLFEAHSPGDDDTTYKDCFIDEGGYVSDTTRAFCPDLLLETFANDYETDKALLERWIDALT